MKYQIQIVEDANHDNREVIASKDGLMNEVEVNAWFAETIGSREEPVKEGFTAYTVVDTHGWFKQADPQASIATSTIDLNNNSVKEEGEAAKIDSSDKGHVDFDTVAQIELKLAKARRKKKFEQQRKLNAAIAGLMAEQS